MHVHKIAVVAISVSLAFSLSACAAGNNAPTRMTTQVTDGVDGVINTYGNDIKVSSVLLVAQSDGSAVLVGSIVNENPTEDNLLGINIGGVNATLTQKALVLKQNEPIRFAGDSANVSAAASNINATPGDHVKVQFYFATAGLLTLDVIVRERSGIYANVGA